MTEAAVNATLKTVDDARAEGLDVSFDLIPNHLAGGIYSTPYVVSALIPWLRVAGSKEQLAEALEMKAFREEVKATIMSGKWYSLNPNLTPTWAMGPTIVECREKRFEGKTVVQVAAELKEDHLDALMDIIRADPYAKAMLKGGSDAALLMFYRHPAAMIGIDTFGVDDKWEIRAEPGILPNENSYGGFARYLRRAVRETSTLTLEEAVRKVTGLPARKFRLRDRGELKAGNYADVVLFDPDTVADRGDAVNPRVYPEDIRHVLVNGVVTVRDSKHTGAMAGKVLRRE